jgi:hypothetical protein
VLALRGVVLVASVNHSITFRCLFRCTLIASPRQRCAPALPHLSDTSSNKHISTQMRSTVLCLADATRDRNAKWGTVLSVQSRRNCKPCIDEDAAWCDRLQAPLHTRWTADSGMSSEPCALILLSCSGMFCFDFHITATCRVSPSTNNISPHVQGTS